MDFETLLQSLLTFVKNCDNVYFVAYAIGTCLVTQLFKKLFVNKINHDVLHKFDFAVLLPFVFGGLFSAVDILLVQKADTFTFALLLDWAVNCATIGALATVIFKFCSSLSGKSLKSILKDDLFGAFYTQLLYFGTVREKLLSKQMTLSDFISSVKIVLENATAIYQQDISAEDKKAKLCDLLKGIIDENSISACLNVLDRTLNTLVKKDKK